MGRLGQRALELAWRRARVSINTGLNRRTCDPHRTWTVNSKPPSFATRVRAAKMALGLAEYRAERWHRLAIMRSTHTTEGGVVHVGASKETALKPPPPPLEREFGESARMNALAVVRSQ